MSNPFTLKVISNHTFFCNRIKEQADLLSFAGSRTNVVLYSPRRYGKTSLIRRVQDRLVKEQEALVSYTDFFGASSVDDVARRIAKSIYQMLQPHDNLFRKSLKLLKTFKPVLQPSEDGSTFTLSVQPAAPALSGIELLEKTMADLGTFIKSTDVLMQITFDEFQEITELRDSRIEGVLRKQIQEHPVAYFFVGSRRRILLDMFVDQKRPFYQSAVNYQLRHLPRDEFGIFVQKCFRNAGKECPETVVSAILDYSGGHPYYTQKLSFYVFESSGTHIGERDVDNAFEIFLEGESIVFESMLQGVAPQQIALLKALAREPSPSIMSNRYMNTHDLKSVGGVQSAVKKLTQMDFIEKNDQKVWHLVDPIFSVWLNRTY